MAGEKVDKNTFHFYYKALTPKVNDAQINLFKNPSIFSNSLVVAPFSAFERPVKSEVQTQLPFCTSMELAEAKIEAINYLAQVNRNSRTAFDEQNKGEGFIEKGYNWGKDILKSDLSRSAVARTLYVEQTGIEFLDRANKGELTKSQYREARLDLLLDIIPNSDTLSNEDKLILRAKYAEMSPEKLNTFIEKVKTAPEEEYKKLEILNADTISKDKAQSDMKSNPEFKGVKFVQEDKSYTPADGEELISFEDVFQNERGRVFDKEKVAKFIDEKNNFEAISYGKNVVEEMHSRLDSDIALVKGNNEGSVLPEQKKASDLRLETSFSSILKDMYDGDEAKINALLKKIHNNGLITYENGKIKVSEYAQGIKSQLLADVAQKFMAQTDSNYRKLLNGQEYSEYEQTYAQSYLDAYGEKNGKELVEAFSQAQQSAVGYAKMGVQGLGMIVTLAGAACPPLAYGGIALATYGGTALDVANEISKDGDMSAEAKARLKKEALVDTAFLGTGILSGAAGQTAKMTLLAKSCPNLVAYAADFGVNAAAGLLASQVVNGEIDLKGETTSQTIALLTGIVAQRKLPIGTAPSQKQIKITADNLHSATISKSRSVKEDFSSSFGRYEDVQVQQRVKDYNSLQEKVARKIDKIEKKISSLEEQLLRETSIEKQEYIKNEINANKSLGAKMKQNSKFLGEELGDTLGQRLIFDNPTPENMEKTVKELINGIDEGKFVITELENYAVNKDGFYFNQEQVDRIKEACRKKGVAPNYSEGFKASGYTTTQMNIRYKNGVDAELQIRGKDVHELAESEHILYDIRENKDIAKGNEKHKEILKPVYEGVAKIDSDKDLKDLFEKYLKDYYQYKRDIEIGKSVTPPQLDSRLPQALDMDNIIKINELLH